MLSNLKTQARLLILMGMVMMLGVVIVGWSLLTIVRINALGSQLVELDQQASDALQASNTATSLALADLSAVLTFEDSYLNDHAAQRALLVQFTRTSRERLDDPESVAALDAIDEKLAQIDANWARFMEINEEWDAATVEIEAAEASGEPYTGDFSEEDAIEVIDGLANENAALAADIRTEANTIAANTEAELDSVKEAADREFLATLGIGGAAFVLFLLFSLLAALTIVRSINAPMVTLIDAARSIERGAFDPKPLHTLAKRTDEIGRIARSMLEMAENVDQRRTALEAEAAELRAKLA